EAINFDFYEHPGDRIAYFDKGFTYKTDGLKRGQIGIKKAAGASLIGFHDIFRGVVCIRVNLGGSDGAYFNIADNDQPEGPYSTADNYSIFNSDPTMNAFELETVGCARIENGRLCGSKLVSVTTFAVLDPASQAEQAAMRLLG
ncbi:MAG: hypothetical protein IT210_02175, partial [Armatimonadetes bacterium]|nr:hypothetical protein [Armatimonadota bacterium]